MPMDFLRSRSSQSGKLEKYIHQEKWTKACQLLNSKAFHQDLQSKIKKAEKRYRSTQSSRSLSLQSVNSETIESVTTSFIGLFNLAILYDAPLDFISLFTEQFPDITRTKDRHGMTPLHLACATKATSLDLIQLLLRADLGKSVAVQDSNGRTPLHYCALVLLWQLLGYRPNNRQSCHEITLFYSTYTVLSAELVKHAKKLTKPLLTY